MPVTVDWDDDTKSIILERMFDPLTTEESLDGLRQVVDLLGGSAGEVNLIIDRSQRSKRMHMNWLVLTRQYLKVLQNHHLRFLIVVTPDKLTRTLLESARRLFPETSKRAHIVASLEEAREKLATLTMPAGVNGN